MDNKIVIKIFSCIKRINYAKSLSQKLGIGLDNIWFDSRKDVARSFCYEVANAWESLENNNADWAMLIQDDVEVCNNFIELCNKIVYSHKDTIFSLFPFDYIPMLRKNVNIDRNNPYWEVDILSGCCIIVPMKYIHDMVKSMRGIKNAKSGDDQAIAQFAYYNKIPLLTTIPSLIQHIGDVSILDPSKPIRRTQYFEENPVANWSSQKINKL